MRTGPGSPRVVEFNSGDATLRGLLFERSSTERRPAVAMAHGFSATASKMVADRYATVLHSAGFTVLLFDHRGFGLSDGEPRQTINRWTHLAEYRDALGFLAGLPSVDPARIAIWGDSHSGATALGVAAFDPRVSAVVVQVPACGDEVPPRDPDASAFHALRAIYVAGGPGEVEVHSIGPMAVVSPDQLTMPSLLLPITAFRWFIDYGGMPGTGWLNQATLELPQTAVEFNAGIVAPHLRGASLWVIAEDDEMPGARAPVSMAAYQSAPQPKELLAIDGGHFGLLYDNSPLFDRVSAAQTEFLLRHL